MLKNIQHLFSLNQLLTNFLLLQYIDHVNQVMLSRPFVEVALNLAHDTEQMVVRYIAKIHMCVHVGFQCKGCLTSVNIWYSFMESVSINEFSKSL